MNQFNQSLYRRRKLSNSIGLTLSMGSMVLGLAVLLWILYVLLFNGLAALDLNMFTQDTPAPGSEGGGLRNAIVGSLMMVGFTVLLATPVRIFAGLVIVEFGVFREKDLAFKLLNCLLFGQQMAVTVIGE